MFVGSKIKWRASYTLGSTLSLSYTSRPLRCQAGMALLIIYICNEHQLGMTCDGKTWGWWLGSIPPHWEEREGITKNILNMLKFFQELQYSLLKKKLNKCPWISSYPVFTSKNSAQSPVHISETKKLFTQCQHEGRRKLQNRQCILKRSGIWMGHWGQRDQL